MLRLRNTHNFHSTQSTTSRSLELSPIKSEHDELIEDIEKSTEQAWELVDTPDVRELNSFWSGVQDDLRRDPKWFSFADD